MDWKSVGNAIAKFAPLVGGALGGPVGGAVGGLVSAALGTDDDPAQVMEALQRDPQAALKMRELQDRHRERLEELSLDRERLAMEERRAQLAEVNATYRAEVTSDDKYVRRWRPTFGYAVCLTWVVAWMAVCYVLVFETAQAGAVVNALAATGTMWGVALAVLGVSVYKRSQDKEVSAGIKPGILSALRPRDGG